jgi:hypothetical protein
MGCGCLFALLAVLSPRLAVLVLWLFTPLVNRAFDGAWLWPLLGLLFLPFTTLMFVLVVAPLGAADIWGWLLVLFGLLMDLRGYFDGYANRERVASYTPYPMGSGS